MVCHDYNCRLNFHDTEGETLLALKKAYGQDRLRAQDEATNGDRDATDFEDFMVYCYPSGVLDALEAFYRLLPDHYWRDFQAEVNWTLREEGSPWQFCDGRAFMVDSEFLDALQTEAIEAMHIDGFLGAHKEFKEARSHLLAGDSAVAILKANCAFESALKTLLSKTEGTAKDLLRGLLEESNLLEGVPSGAQKAIAKTVLQGLPVLRNKLGGHGQGADPVEIPRAYGYLALNLAASYIKFLHDIRCDSAPPKDPEEDTDFNDDDVPF